MSKAYRIYIEGEGKPIEWISGYVINQEVKAVKEQGKEILYIEDIDYKPLIDKELESLQAGKPAIVYGYKVLSYIGEQYTLDGRPIRELDARRELQLTHERNRMLMRSDVDSYIEKALRVIASEVTI